MIKWLKNKKLKIRGLNKNDKLSYEEAEKMLTV